VAPYHDHIKSRTRMSTNATIADIARQAGVGTATVDRVLNHRPGVNAETVQRVLQVVAELGAPPPIPPRGPRRPVHVRPVRVSDAESFARLHELPSVMEGTFQLPFQTRALWDKRLGTPIPNSHILLAELDGRVVGSSGLFPLGQGSRLRHQASFGISVHPDVQGQGVGHALLSAITSLADDYLGLERIVLEVYVDNDRARALYERFGFELEGTMQMVAFRRGTYVDAHQMARLRPRVR
jgi:putative acetyltransferase